MRLETVIVEVISKCNLKCTHCYSFFNQKEIMTKEMFERITKEIYDLGCTRLIISGGEPMLLGEDIYNFVRIARKNGISYIAITTNGTIDNMVVDERIKDIDLIQVSIDGCLETHERIRGKNTYKKSIENIKKFSKYTEVGIMMTVHKGNYNEILEVYKLSKSLKAKFAIEIMTSCGRGKRLKKLEKKELINIKKTLKRYNIDCSDPIFFVDEGFCKYFSNNNILLGCSAGITAFSIDSIGNIYPCVRLRVKVGNVNDEGGVKKIWEENKVLKELRNRDLLKGNCGKCKSRYICGGCRARAFLRKEDYLDEDYDCIE